MLSYERFEEMFKLQDQLEIHINGPDWRNAGHNYRLCIFMEGAEIIDATPWKHWKDLDKTIDLDAVAGEIVDIWHFAMAHLMCNPNNDIKENYATLIGAVKEYDYTANRSIEELVVGLTFTLYAKNIFNFGNFVGLMHFARMSMEDLYVLYVSKNVLNKFRQDHGFKDGTYLKNWGGHEDTHHLRELAYSLIEGGDISAEALYDALELRYQLVTR